MAKRTNHLNSTHSQSDGQSDRMQHAIQTQLTTRRLKPPGIGEFDSGHTHTAARADQILTRAAKRGGFR